MKIKCGKCSYYHEYENAPIGKDITRPNWAERSGKRVETDCNACNGTGNVPDVVINSIKKRYPEKAEKILSELKWGGDHYYFILDSLYVGCEVKDGYLHT